jgi:4-amino-4-deoxy-L-arabinose transferase-like glycosyltransferase
MSRMMVEFWLMLVMGFSAVAMVASIILIHRRHWQEQDKVFRIGFLLLCLGLGVQTFRSVHYLQFGTYPIDFYFPTWIVKDAGFCLIVYSKFMESRGEKND